MDVKFIESHGFDGVHYTMIVGEDFHNLESNIDGDHIENAISILKTKYGIDMNYEDVKFEWGGTL